MVMWVLEAVDVLALKALGPSVLTNPGAPKYRFLGELAQSLCKQPSSSLVCHSLNCGFGISGHRPVHRR